MTAPLSAQRVEELREHLMFLGAEGISCSKQPCPYCADLLDILSAYEKMRADWDKIPELRADKIRYKIRAEQAEAQLAAMRAENERLRAEFSTLKKAYDDECAWRGRGYRDLLTRAEKAEAQLEKQRPLVEAVMGMSIKTLRLWRGLHGPDGEMESFLRAALKYREEEGK
jgi:predicted RNase H-like nuclease (RuvC/YqgF family)